MKRESVLYPLVVFIFFFSLGSCGLINSNARGSAEDLNKDENTVLSFDTIQNLIIIEAEVNGYTGKFLFDNGFTLSAVHPDFAKKVGITFNESASVRDINGNRTTLAQTRVESIKIGDFDFRNTGFYQIDTKKFFPCDDIDGVIGGSIINKANWKIQYRDKKIELSRKRFDTPENSTVLKIGYNRANSALTKLTIREKEFLFKIDIGMSGETTLGTNQINLFSGQKAVMVDGVTSIGATGLGKVESNYEIVHRQALSKDDIELPVRAELELDESPKYTGYIGIGYLKHYDVILNSTKKQYILTNPVAPEDKHPEGYGVNLYYTNGAYRIITKNPSDTLLNGIPVMTEVTHIDSRFASSFESVCELREYLLRKYEEKTDLVLRLKDYPALIVLPHRRDEWIYIREE